MSERVRRQVGAVNYLNTRPLVYGLAEQAPWIDLKFDLPSRLADGLHARRFDAALIPSIEFLRDPSLGIISDACIACRGPVWSVKLFFRTPPEEVRTLALDEGSRTSATLARILLAQKFDATPQLVPLPIGASIDDSNTDAVLLIGDRAMQAPRGPFAAVWDLGDEWLRWTGLPFVFAMWVARPGFDSTELAAELARARDRGLENLERIVQTEAAPLGLSRPECLAYLRDNLHFTLGPQELRGLDVFYTLALEMKLAPMGADLGLSVCEP